MCVCVCVCVHWHSTEWTHTHILIHSEDCELTGLKVDESYYHHGRRSHWDKLYIQKRSDFSHQHCLTVKSTSLKMSMSFYSRSNYNAADELMNHKQFLKALLQLCICSNACTCSLCVCVCVEGGWVVDTGRHALVYAHIYMLMFMCVCDMKCVHLLAIVSAPSSYDMGHHKWSVNCYYV